jgi:hypothetical protein
MTQEPPRVAARKARKPRDGGRLAAVSLALGTLATMLGKVADIKKALFELLGPERLQSFHMGMSVLVVLLFIVGYAALGWWLWRRFVSVRRDHWRRVGLAALVVGGLATTGCSIYVALPPQPDVDALMQEKLDTWSTELLGLHKPGAALRTDRRDASAPDQAWASAQVLYALLAPPPRAAVTARANTLRQLLDAIDKRRLPDPQGWGYYNQFRWGATEVAAWVTLAEVQSLREDWSSQLWPNDREVGLLRLQRDLALLRSRQLASSGAFTPIAGGQTAHERTYATIMALWALIEARRAQLCGGDCIELEGAIRDAIKWLLRTYEDDVDSWVPRPARSNNLDPYPGLTAQTIYVLERARPLAGDLLHSEYATYRRLFFKSIGNAADARNPALRDRDARSNERTHDGDVALADRDFMLEGSTFLWFPWTLAACSTQATMKASEDDAELIARGCAQIGRRMNDLVKFADSEMFIYVMAESLLALRLQAAAAPPAGASAPAAQP